MQFPTLILLLLTLTTSTSLAQERSTASYDPMYDNPGLSTDQTACSDGVNGLSRAYPTIGLIPRYPFVGASPKIAGWNSPSCGKCYTLRYGGRPAIIVKAIDRGDRFVLSKRAMDEMTGGMASTLGTVSVEFSETWCG